MLKPVENLLNPVETYKTLCAQRAQLEIEHQKFEIQNSISLKHRCAGRRSALAF